MKEQDLIEALTKLIDTISLYTTHTNDDILDNEHFMIDLTCFVLSIFEHGKKEAAV